MVDKKKNEYTVESSGIPRRDYGEWFWSIYDEGLKEELIKNVSWVQKGNLM